MPDGSAYDLDNKTLLNKFTKACLTAGFSNSGLCIDVMASVDANEARYLKGVVFSRLEGLKPPFKERDKVSINPKFQDHWFLNDIKKTNNIVISRIYYDVDREKWELKLIGFEQLIYAEFFLPVQ